MNNLFSMIQQFNDFQRKIKQTGKDPTQILSDLIQSGKVTRDQVDRATKMANTLKSFMGGKL